MIKKFIAVLLTLCVACAVSFDCRADEAEAEQEKAPHTAEKKTASKSSKKAARQKARRAKKAKGVKHNQTAVNIKQGFKNLHDFQMKLLRNRDDEAQVKEWTAKIQRDLKKMAPLLKQLGPFEGDKIMTDLDKLIEAGKKLAPEGEEVTDGTALELLHKKQLEQIEAFRTKKK